uniref:Somatolactin alpha n=1 Tax=Denticeps clupeoides TaxID=299321 RepID=A0A8C4B0C0_9TELE
LILYSQHIVCWTGLFLWCLHGMLGSAMDCKNGGAGNVHCSISVDKLLDRAIHHSELIYIISEESTALFVSEALHPGKCYFTHNLISNNWGHCNSKTPPMPTSKSDVQQISDKWLLQSVLILIRFWMDPLKELQSSLDRYDNAPSALLNKTKWISTKLMNLKEGVLVLIKKMLDEGTLDPGNSVSLTSFMVPSDETEYVLRDYSLLTCFKKDAHKIETFLKLLKCRQTDNLSCSLF